MDESIFTLRARDLERALRGTTAGEVVLIVQESLVHGGPLAAIEICEAARRLGLDEPSIAVSEAAIRFRLGQSERALAMVESLLLRAPASLAALNLKALMLASLSRAEESLLAFSEIIERFPDFPGAQARVSSLLLPGPSYRDRLSAIHRALRPDTYLEIGVETGATLALATTTSVAVGVDPAECAAPGAARLYRMESDAFFATESKATVFDGRGVDLTFIDGMHLFEYALRDFANAERWAAEGGTIVLHDCLPVTRIAARRERTTGFWVGDIWKVLDVLLEHRPDLRVSVIPTAPSGLMVVRGLDPGSTVLTRRMDAIVSSYLSQEYPHTPGAWPARYPLVSNDDVGLAEALA